MTLDDSTGRDDTMASALRSVRADSFAPGFADRVMTRLATVAPASLTRVLERQFVFLAPAAAAAIIAFALLNMRTVGTTSVTAALGIAPVTVAEAYSVTALADLQP